MKNNSQNLTFSDQPNDIEEHKPSRCRNCRASLEKAEIIRHERRQIVDIAESIHLKAIEHRSQIHECPNCRHRNKGNFPQMVNCPTQYGQSVRSLAIYLVQKMGISTVKAVKMFEIFRIRIPEAWIIKATGGQSEKADDAPKFSEKPDRIVIHAPDKCERCQISLKGSDAIEYESRQIFDIQSAKIEIVEHRSDVFKCSKCGSENQKRFPSEVSEMIQYGSMVNTYANHFMAGLGLSIEKTAKIFKDIFKIKISEEVLRGLILDIGGGSGSEKEEEGREIIGGRDTGENQKGFFQRAMAIACVGIVGLMLFTKPDVFSYVEPIKNGIGIIARYSSGKTISISKMSDNMLGEIQKLDKKLGEWLINLTIRNPPPSPPSPKDDPIIGIGNKGNNLIENELRRLKDEEKTNKSLATGEVKRGSDEGTKSVAQPVNKPKPKVTPVSSTPKGLDPIVKKQIVNEILSKIDSSRYHYNGDDTITDNQTGLMWHVLDSYLDSGDKELNYEQSLAYVNNLNNLKIGGYSDWRFPNSEELAGIYKNKPFFPNGYTKGYWGNERLDCGKQDEKRSTYVIIPTEIPDYKPCVGKSQRRSVHAVRGVSSHSSQLVKN